MPTPCAALPRRPRAPAAALALGLLLAACGGDDEPGRAPEAAGSIETAAPQADEEPVPDSAPGEPAAVESDVSVEPAPPAGGPVSFRRRPYAPGDRFEAHTTVDLELDATLGLGFLSQEVRYRRVEEELLAVTILPEEEGQLRRSLEFKQRHTTTTLPVVGEERDDRRAAGKTFTVVSTAAGDVIYGKKGNEVHEKLAREVGYSLSILGRQPVFFSILPEGDEVLLEPGTTLEVQGEEARRVVGLPFEELGVDSLQLTLRAPESADDPLATFDTKALFSGDAVLGDSHLRLKAKLKGKVVVTRETMRVASVSLKGQVDAEHEPAPGAEEGLLSAEGEGPLKIKREVSDG